MTQGTLLSLEWIGFSVDQRHSSGHFGGSSTQSRFVGFLIPLGGGCTGVLIFPYATSPMLVSKTSSVSTWSLGSALPAVSFLDPGGLTELSNVEVSPFILVRVCQGSSWVLLLGAFWPRGERERERERESESFLVLLDDLRL